MKRRTREKLLEQAERRFAQVGFYGTSLDDVAREVGISKQGLLHHFPSKETLYAAVLETAAERLVDSIEATAASGVTIPEQLMAIFQGMSTASERDLQVVILLMRELLDNRERAEQANKWFMKPFLDALVGLVEQGQHHGHFEQHYPLAFVYQLLGATQYYLVSQPTLKRLYSKAEYAEHQRQHLALLAKHIGVT